MSAEAVVSIKDIASILSVATILPVGIAGYFARTLWKHDKKFDDISAEFKKCRYKEECLAKHSELKATIEEVKTSIKETEVRIIERIDGSKNEEYQKAMIDMMAKIQGGLAK